MEEQAKGTDGNLGVMPGEETDAAGESVLDLMPGEEMTDEGIEGTDFFPVGEVVGTKEMGLMPGEEAPGESGPLSEEMAEAVAEGLEAFELTGTWKMSFFLASPKSP